MPGFRQFLLQFLSLLIGQAIITRGEGTRLLTTIAARLTQGQNWGLPPLIPERLRASGYQLFIDTLRANLPMGGMLRMDHVMGLFRLLWIPRGVEAARGAYVTYPGRELLAILALESARRRALIIGEDLGTVPPRIRRELGKSGVFSYRVFYFERDGNGHFLAPEAYPARAMATVTTHDLPTLAGFWQGHDLALKRTLTWDIMSVLSTSA